MGDLAYFWALLSVVWLAALGSSRISPRFSIGAMLVCASLLLWSASALLGPVAWFVAMVAAWVVALWIGWKPRPSV